MEIREFTIENAFKKCFYTVPDYQREYVWYEGHVTDLLRDINEHIESDSPYFIGTVLVSQKGGEGPFYVIDGQQRLTTIFLILCALRELFDGDERSEIISNLIEEKYSDGQSLKANRKLKLQYEDTEKVIEIIIKANEKPEKVRRMTENELGDDKIHGSIKNILDAYEVVYKFLESLIEGNKIEKYFYYLLGKVIFVQISADAKSALKIFVTTNKRGEDLNPMDLLKILIFEHVPLEKSDDFSGKWKQITAPIEKHEIKPERFLQYFLMANYDTHKTSGNPFVRHDEIYDWVSNNAALTEYKEKPFDFVHKIIWNVEKYVSFNEELGKEEQNQAMYSLGRLVGSRNFQWHYIFLLAAAELHERSRPVFDYFVARLEEFLFCYIFAEASSRASALKEHENRLSLWAKRIKEIRFGNR